MINEVTLLGYLGRDPESRSFGNGGRAVSFSLATSEPYTDKRSGERREKTEWHNVVIYNEALCNIAEQYLKKGSLVYVRGKLETRKWQDQQGNDRWSTEIVLRFDAKLKLMPRGAAEGGGSSRSDDRGDSGGGGRGGGSSSYRQESGGGYGYSRDLDDEIPF